MITMMPKKTSYQMIFLPVQIGSRKDVKKAPVDRHAKVTEMFETLMALKNVNQCKAMMIPAINNWNNIFLGSRIGIFLYQM